MKQKIAEKFREEHKEDIKAAMAAMEAIVTKLAQVRENHPNVGYMIHIGIMDPMLHWTHRHVDIDKQLAAEILRDELQEEEELRDWVLENIDKNVGKGYIQHFDLS